MCANSEGSGEAAPSLVAYVISTIISWAGSIINDEINRVKEETNTDKYVMSKTQGQIFVALIFLNVKYKFPFFSRHYTSIFVDS